MSKRFISRSLPISLEGLSLASAPNVIRSQALEEIHSTQCMINSAKTELEQHKQSELESIEQRRAEIEQYTKEEIIQQTLEAFQQLESYKEDYFNRIEEHCATVAKKAVNYILDDVPDEERIRLAIKAAMGEIKGETEVVLTINSCHEAMAADLISGQDWKIKYDDAFSEDECQIDVPLGAYQTSFTYRFDMFCKALSESNNLGEE